MNGVDSQVLAVVLIASAGIVWLLFDFTAEDAYIVYRYAENASRHGALIYNSGEFINALTSPLHGVVMALLYALSGNTVIANKILGLVLLFGAAVFAARRYRGESGLPALAVALIVLPAPVMLWTLGGLETPLLAFLVAATTLAFLDRTPGPRRTYLVLVLCGLAFLARHDSVFFFASIGFVELWRTPAWRHRILSIVSASLLPLLWLAFAARTYGDILPTSYYIKTPRLDVATAITNATYIATGLLLMGSLPAWGLGWWFGRRRVMRSRAAPALPSLWPLYLAIATELAYTLTMATAHMMFSFRSLVPYVPAIGLLAVERLSQNPAYVTRRSSIAAVRIFTLACCVFAAYHAWTTWSRSINAFSPVGELRATSAHDFTRLYMQSLADQADAIRRDWNNRGDPTRQPRVFTYAGGVVPYSLPEAYVFETLASYRHGGPRYWNWSQYADYTMIVTPRFGPAELQIQGDPELYEMIFERTFSHNGSQQSFQVYRNAAPLPNPLGNRIDRGCQPLGQDAVGCYEAPGQTR